MHLPRLVLASVCTVLFTSTASYADTLTRSLSQSIDYSGTGPIEDFGGIALFDPDLGTLNSVTQTLTGTVTFVANGSGSSYTIQREWAGHSNHDPSDIYREWNTQRPRDIWTNS